MSGDYFGLPIDMSGKTWVDRHGSKRTKPMEVLVLGMPRTGTASMRMALTRLGYDHVYHMASVFHNPPDADIWHEAAAAWVGKRKPLTREEWDQVLGHAMAVTDFPAAVFWKELIEMYPEAKVVLTNRDRDAWWKSFNATIGASIKKMRSSWLATIDPTFVGRIRPMAYNMFGQYFGTMDVDEARYKEVFVQHYDNIRKATPPERLLDYNVSQGWEPLCEFLGKPVPEEDFPRVNESDYFHKTMGTIMGLRMQIAVKRVLSMAAPIVVAGVAVYFARTRGYF
ncbi:P-loop containing nucleoside triphosphate hydrolase protein [Lineolata rhizophorae]|uniref:P-loop containing nucleoside triphosphate hydrolase protein n=1 Tax=Lineolata rhizophorae TaxID=578093 RepID=A0A6A6PC96_9PEZI|nr:P-loop containing nucleoside triphosphate hydrolase protein [Lineolata rhizophorae]